MAHPDTIIFCSEYFHLVSDGMATCFSHKPMQYFDSVSFLSLAIKIHFDKLSLTIHLVGLFWAGFEASGVGSVKILVIFHKRDYS